VREESGWHAIANTMREQEDVVGTPSSNGTCEREAWWRWHTLIERDVRRRGCAAQGRNRGGATFIECDTRTKGSVTPHAPSNTRDKGVVVLVHPHRLILERKMQRRRGRG